MVQQLCRNQIPVLVMFEDLNEAGIGVVIYNSQGEKWLFCQRRYLCHFLW